MEINKKELKEILKEQRKEYQRYLKVAVESFESQVKLIAESVVGIQKQLITIRDMVAQNTKDIEIIKTDIEIIKNSLKKKVDLDEFISLEKRVILLEKRLSIKLAT